MYPPDTSTPAGSDPGNDLDSKISLAEELSSENSTVLTNMQEPVRYFLNADFWMIVITVDPLA